MNIAKLEEKLSEITAECNPDSFIYDFMLAYGLPKATISKLKKGVGNKGKEEEQVVYKNKVFFHPVKADDSNTLCSIIDELRKDDTTYTHSPRFIIVTDYSTLLAYDTKIDEPLDIPFKDLPSYLDFFLPWAGREKYQVAMESPADIKAADRMARLYNEILKNNPNAEKDADARHSLNIFLSRLLFCYFAEDTEIFEKDIFTDAIHKYTKEDGSDQDTFLNDLFAVLNSNNRAGCHAYLQKFPYVNGGLFGDIYYAPKFTPRARRMMLECGKLNWSEINPDIFGSMIQGVVDPEQRGNLGMHYTSVPNIMKVIEPLFLDDLKAEFEKIKGNAKKLKALHSRIAKIRFFDPACGSGNFLIIAYKEVRKLEIEILKQRKELEGYIPLHSLITLDHFYGIELADFAHEVAILSLWLAEHQMNVLFKAEFGQVRATLPLRESGNIICGNATRLDWAEVCPRESDDVQHEVYIMGNPPYLGSTFQDASQKKDLSIVFEGINNYKNLDYISCWFFKGAKYIHSQHAQCAFVTTNSICQGEQVALLWPYILTGNVQIGFAHTSFKWTNNAKGNAGVTCAVVGIRNHVGKKCSIYSKDTVQDVENITPYLTIGKTNYVKKHSNPISSLPHIDYGNKPVDGGNLILSTEEKNNLLASYPASELFVKKLYGSNEFIKGLTRWCLWIEDKSVQKALEIPPIANRIAEVKKMRLSSPKAKTVEQASIPHKFGEIRYVANNTLIVPRVSSERRDYIPIGFLEQDSMITDLAFGIADASTYVLGLLSSRMHMSWVRAVAGRLKTDYRYSSVLCYNTFPVPKLSKKQKEEIEELSYEVLDARDAHVGKTMAQLYDPDKMPDDLRKAHRKLDLAVDRCYRKKDFESDSERLEVLFSMYEKMTAGKK